MKKILFATSASAVNLINIFMLWIKLLLRHQLSIRHCINETMYLVVVSI
jgi:hypothetical protein